MTTTLTAIPMKMTTSVARLREGFIPGIYRTRLGLSIGAR